MLMFLVFSKRCWNFFKQNGYSIVSKSSKLHYTLNILILNLLLSLNQFQEMHTSWIFKILWWSDKAQQTWNQNLKWQ